jgi:glyoxylate reductase
VPQRLRVVVAPALPAPGLELLRARFDISNGDPPPDPDQLRRRAAGAAALVADPTVPVDAELLDAAGAQLKLVANFAVGYDNVDLEACRARGVLVTNTPDVLTNATAELTLALMLAASRRLGEAERLVRGGRWTGWDPHQLLGRELAESTIGIVGLGRIGSRVAELLQGFAPRLLYASHSPRPELETKLGVQRSELRDLIAEADIVTLHVPLSRNTQHLVDADLLAGFKPGSILVNTSRGGLVDQAALAAALRSGLLAAAALDVYEHEPQVPAELLELENIVLAPHIGSATASARNAMARLVAENVISVLEGHEPLTPVD